MVEPMQAMGLLHPAGRVTLRMSSQIAKTQGTINLLGQIATEMPCPVLVVLPSIDEARSYNRDKLQPMIDNSPVVRDRVRDVKRADETGSTTMFKKFPGGSVELTGANSSKGLQMRTKRVVILDEVSEFPWDVDGRGDPVAMAEARAIAYGRRSKIIKVSTPGIEGMCRVSSAYDEGSAGRYHVPCPHCGAMQPLDEERLVYSSANPGQAEYACRDCGGLARQGQKAAMLAAGKWVHTHPERVTTHASYDLSALYSPFVSWGQYAEKREQTRDDPLLDKVFTQQWAGRPWKQKYDTVPHQVLWERRTEWPRGTIPAGVLFLEGATDVQGDRLEWAVYGFDRHFGQHLIDGGMLMGDPSGDAVWFEHDALIRRQWPDAWGRNWSAESWGVDSGYLSHHVYRYARRHAARGQPVVRALDGRPKWGLAAVGSPKLVEVDWLGKKIGSVQLWPVGTWDLKGELTSAMMLTQQGPDAAGIWPRGAMRFPTWLDLGFFEQLTAESLVTRNVRNGYAVREWIKTRSRNEQLDLAVYARALARHDTAGFTDQGWARLAAKRMGGDRTPDLIALMQGGIGLEGGVDAVVPPPAPAPAPIPQGIPRRSVSGFGRRLA